MTIKLPQGISLHKNSIRIAFRPPGYPRQIKRVIGPYTKANIKAAEVKLNAIRYDIMLGTFSWAKHFPNSKEAVDGDLTVAQAIDEFFLDRGQWKPTTRKKYEHKCDVLKRLIGAKTLKLFNERDALTLRGQLLKGEGAIARSKKSSRVPDVVNLYLNICAEVFRVAFRTRIVKENPFDFVERVKKQNKSSEEVEEAPLTELDVYTIDEAAAIIASAHGEHTQNLITFLFWSGVRPGEAAALLWSDVCIDTGRVTIRRTATPVRGVTQSPKTGKARIINLPDAALGALIRQREHSLLHNSGKVWLNMNRQPLDVSTIFHPNTWTRLCKRAGVRRLVSYTTRHSFASWMLAAGESPVDIAAHLGHASTQMIHRVYGHFIPKKEKKWTLNGPSADPIQNFISQN